MALQKLKYNDSFIYIEDDVPYDEKGIVLEKKENNLENTQEIKPIKLKKESLEDTISMEPIGVDNE